METGPWRSPLDPQRVLNARVIHWQEQAQQQREEELTVEEPFEVRIDHRSLAVIMRTPGHDHELAMGFLYNEGIISCADDILAIQDESDADGLPLANVVNVTLRDSRLRAALQEQPSVFERHFAVSASCGLCGKNSIADLLLTTPALEPDNLRFPAPVLYELPGRLRIAQSIFSHTGGLHAAGLFDLEGQLQLLREDVGRHNAVDKIIGYGMGSAHFPYRERILMLSGRASFEIIQKALLARIPCVAAISAPSSLAVELAERGGITLIGFLRGRDMNVYTHHQRITEKP
jgi:FdhD protein